MFYLKKVFAVLLGVVIAIVFSYGTTHTVEAKTNFVINKNCKELNKMDPGGVSQSLNVKNQGGKTHYKLYVSSALYNTKDHDLIECER